MEKSNGGREFLGKMSENSLLFLYIFCVLMSGQTIANNQHKNGLKNTAYNWGDW
jgi:hypothetical protein